MELGWKGSAEPRRGFEMPLGLTNLSCSDSSTSKHDLILLDFDINVWDETLLEEMASRGSALVGDSTTDSASNCANEASDSFPVRGSSGLDFDLNRVDETNDIGTYSTSSKRDGEASVMHAKPLGGFHVQRDFDLNNGPVGDDASADYNIAAAFCWY